MRTVSRVLNGHPYIKRRTPRARGKRDEGAHLVWRQGQPDCEPALAALEAMDTPLVRISLGANRALSSSVFMNGVEAADDCSPTDVRSAL